jgi:peptidoglycan/xylan/chitin deacetylase (PgdA/CDA1 family)
MAWSGVDLWLDGPHEDELTGMSWAEVRTLADAGWEVGSHTCTHARLTELDQPALEAELRDSRRECEERLGVRCRSISYPYGEIDPRVIEGARKANYEAAASLPEGRFDRPQLLCWPRVGVYRNDRSGRFRLKTSSVLRAARGLQAWGAADRVRRAAGASLDARHHDRAPIDT